MFTHALAALLLGAVEGILTKLHPHHLQGKHADLLQSNVDEDVVHQEPLECGVPVERAPVEFPEGLLVGQNASAGLKMHSGYINVTSEDYLFYWFIEAASKSRDAPIIVWSNGGPGCSGMEGVSTEIGPLILYMSKMGTSVTFPGKLSQNPYSWNEHANLLIVDQPRYVGFSTGRGPYVCSSVDAGLDMVTFLLGWARVFADIVPHPKYIFASESYGGHYVPAWTQAVLDHNEESKKRASDQKEIKLKGILIGNGITDDKIQNDAEFINWAKVEGLIPPDSNPTNEDAARDLMAETLGYEPNYYDYRLVDIPCRGKGCCGIYSYNYTTWSLWFMKSEVQQALNVCGNAGDNCFGPVGKGCSGGCIEFTGCPHGFDHKDKFDYTGALQNALKMGIPITLYYGMQDTACNYVGGYALAEHLGGKHFRNKKNGEIVHWRRSHRRNEDSWRRHLVSSFRRRPHGAFEQWWSCIPYPQAIDKEDRPACTTDDKASSQ